MVANFSLSYVAYWSVLGLLASVSFLLQGCSKESAAAFESGACMDWCESDRSKHEDRHCHGNMRHQCGSCSYCGGGAPAPPPGGGCCNSCSASPYCSPRSGHCHTQKGPGKDYYLTCGGGGPAPAPSGSAPSPGNSDSCLCVFDIDRTLTACHDCDGECPGVRKIHGVHDNGYGPGTLVISQMFNSWQSTKCAKKCYVGIVSHGDADGQNSDMRSFIIDNLYKKATHHIDGAGQHWFRHGSDSRRAPFWTGVQEGQKQHAIRKILDWYKDDHSVKIDDDKVFFFDDKRNNVEGVAGSFFAKYVSEHSRARDGHHGRCGATVEEVDSCNCR